MVVLNAQKIIKDKDKFKCGKHIMEYLVFKCGLPILSYDKRYYYFAYTSELRACLKAMPFYLNALYSIID